MWYHYTSSKWWVDHLNLVLLKSMDLYCCFWYLFLIVVFKRFLEHLFDAFHSDYINTCFCGDVVRTFFNYWLIPLHMETGQIFPIWLMSSWIFFMYNVINHGVAKTCCSTCWLIIETILFLLVPEWGKVCICFIHIWFFAPDFECFAEHSECMHVVIA